MDIGGMWLLTLTRDNDFKIMAVIARSGPLTTHKLKEIDRHRLYLQVFYLSYIITFDRDALNHGILGGDEIVRVQ
jgi:hypothetical protein